MKITMIMAVTADGKIAKDAEHFPDWTAREDKIFFSQETKNAGVIIMGGKTFATLPAPLKDRLNVVITSQKKYEDIPGSVKNYYGKSAEDIKKDLERLGFKEAILGGGSIINGMFLKARAVDEIIIIVAPKLFGEGIPLISGCSIDYNLRLLDTRKINEDSVLLHYRIVY